MDKKEQEFLERLRQTFRIEAEEHLRSLSAGLIELEKTDDPEKGMQVIETVFRDAHSLKGAARSVNLKDIEIDLPADGECPGGPKAPGDKFVSTPARSASPGGEQPKPACCEHGWGTNLD